MSRPRGATAVASTRLRASLTKLLEASPTPLTVMQLQTASGYSRRACQYAVQILTAAGVVKRVGMWRPSEPGPRGGWALYAPAKALAASHHATAPSIERTTSSAAAPSIEDTETVVPPKPDQFQSREEYLEAVIVQLAQALPAGNELRDYLTDVLTAQPA